MDKYQEALGRAKELHEAGNALTKSQMEIVFPELKESKDERIRKDIVFILNEYSHMSEEQGFLCNKSVINDALAYLEKQKEHKPAKWSEDEKKVLDSIIDDYEKAAKSFCGYDGKIMLLKAIRDGEYDLSKQEWSEEDSRILYNVIAYIGYAAGQRGVRDDAFKEANSWLKSLQERFNLQLKQE